VFQKILSSFIIALFPLCYGDRSRHVIALLLHSRSLFVDWNRRAERSVAWSKLGESWVEWRRLTKTGRPQDYQCSGRASRRTGGDLPDRRTPSHPINHIPFKQCHATLLPQQQQQRRAVRSSAILLLTCIERQSCSLGRTLDTRATHHRHDTCFTYIQHRVWRDNASYLYFCATQLVAAAAGMIVQRSSYRPTCTTSTGDK